MVVCVSAAGAGVEECGERQITGAGLEEHDRDVISACWPAVLKAASAAFLARVRKFSGSIHKMVDTGLLLYLKGWKKRSTTAVQRYN